MAAGIFRSLRMIQPDPTLHQKIETENQCRMNLDIAYFGPSSIECLAWRGGTCIAPSLVIWCAAQLIFNG